MPFGEVEARIAAELHREAKGARVRVVDLAVAACAISWNARLWTLNVKDFEDLPGLGLWG